MFSGANPFYHQCVRKTVVAFGSLFNNIYIGGDVPANPAQRIPLTYAPKQKWLRRLSESTIETESGQNYSMTLPRIGFALTNWAYDTTRKRTTMTKKVNPDGLGVNAADKKMAFRYSEVPYTFTFELYIMPDTMDNGLRIIEQILPYFTPSYTVSINYTNIDTKLDIPITLTSLAWEDQYEGNYDNGRMMMYTLTFEAKGYVIGPIREGKFILETQIAGHNIDDIDLSRAENRDYVMLWDRAVQVGTTGPNAPLSVTGTSYDVWHDVELYADITGSWGV